MAEKADLMLAAAKKEEEIDRLTKAIESATKEIEDLPAKLSRLTEEARSKSLASFLNRQKELKSRIDAVIAAKRTEIVTVMDTFPDKGVSDLAGRFEIKELEDHLMQVYPREMIEDYICMNPIPIDDPETAFRLYSSVENMILSLSKGGSLSALIFNGINSLLDSITENPSIGMKAIPAVIMLYFVSVMFLPFLFLIGFSVIGFSSAIQGIFVKSLLRKLYSVKLYLNTSYDEDIFQKTKSETMDEIDQFFREAKEAYTAVIDSRVFKNDLSMEAKLSKEAQLNRKRLEQTRELNNTELQRLKNELSDILDRIEALEKEERKKAEDARKNYLETVSWEYKWMDHVFVDVIAGSKMLMMPFMKGNSCYYSKDEEVLKQFSRIVVFQSMLRMHPEFATQVVLDYKYMGGELTQFLSLEDKCVKLRFSEEDLRKQQDIITNEIKARTKSILSSSANLDEFNALMATYGATGEYYAIIHIFGLEDISGTMKNWFHNGPRVGYIFKFYWTYEEMQQLKDDLPFSDIKDFYEIRDNPVSRTASAVKRIIGIE